MRQKLVGIASRAFPDQPPQLLENSSDEVLRSELISGDYAFGDSSSRSANNVALSQSKPNLSESITESTSPDKDKAFKKSTDDSVSQIASEQTSAMPQSDPPRLPDYGGPLLERLRAQGPHSDDQRSIRKGSTVSSMSSSGSNGQPREACRICNKSSALDRRTLVDCSSCHRKYHRGCHQQDVPTDTRSWSCFKCERKSSSPFSVPKDWSTVASDGPTRPRHTLRSSSPNAKERQFKRPRSSLHNTEHVQSSGHSAELFATPHNLSESQAQREIPQTPNEQDASIIYGDSQGHSQNRAQAVVSESLSSGNQVAQDNDHSIPRMHVQVQVKFRNQDRPNSTRALPQRSQQDVEADLPANQMETVHQFSYSKVTPLFSTEPQAMDAVDDAAMEVDDPFVDQKYIEQVATRVGQVVTMVDQSAQTDHLMDEPITNQSTAIETGSGNHSAFTEACVPSIATQDALARGILEDMKASSDLQSSWLTTDMLNEEAKQRLWRGSQVIARSVLKNSQDRKRDAASQTNSASNLDASTPVVPNPDVISIKDMPNQQSSATTRTDSAPNPQAPTHVGRDTVQTNSEDQVLPMDHVEAQDKEKLAKDDFTQRFTKNIYDLIKPNFAYTDLPKDDFYMKQKPTGPTLAEIKARPTRKQMMSKPEKSASRLGEHIFGQRMKNMMSGVRSDGDPERKLKTTSEVPQQLLDEFGGDVEGFDSLEDLLELPRDVFLKDYNGDLVFADNSNRVCGCYRWIFELFANVSQSARSRSNRNATKYWYGAAAREHP